MSYWLTSLDGSVNFRVDAADPREAFDKMGQHLGYQDFEAMAADLNYTVNNFTVAQVLSEEKQYDELGNRVRLERERDSLIVGAFKALRRLGA